MGDDEIETALASGVSVFSKEVGLLTFFRFNYCNNTKWRVSLASVKRLNWLSVT